MRRAPCILTDLHRTVACGAGNCELFLWQLRYRTLSGSSRQLCEDLSWHQQDSSKGLKQEPYRERVKCSLRADGIPDRILFHHTHSTELCHQSWAPAHMRSDPKKGCGQGRRGERIPAAWKTRPGSSSHPSRRTRCRGGKGTLCLHPRPAG